MKRPTLEEKRNIPHFWDDDEISDYRPWQNKLNLGNIDKSIEHVLREIYKEDKNGRTIKNTNRSENRNI